MQKTDDVISIVARIMKDSHYCHLITIDAPGNPQSRLVQPFDPEDDLTVWIGTDRHSRKVYELQKNPRCLLAYCEPEGQSYVTLKCRAQIREEVEERTKRWKEEWRPFYPDGPSGIHYVLLEIEPHTIEVMSNADAIEAAPSSGRPAILVRSKDGWIFE